jgi:hypothetical protein
MRRHYNLFFCFAIEFYQLKAVIIVDNTTAMMNDGTIAVTPDGSEPIPMAISYEHRLVSVT